MIFMSRYFFLRKKNFFSSVTYLSRIHLGKNVLTELGSVRSLPCLLTQITKINDQQRFLSTNKESKRNDEDSNIAPFTPIKKLNQRARLKQAVRDYGATIIVFHVAISLASLGICYTAVSSGIDAAALLQRIGVPDSMLSSKVTLGGSTFVMAYAVHKGFAPVRIGITLTCAPLIVKYLRKINFLKPPK